MSMIPETNKEVKHHWTGHRDDAGCVAAGYLENEENIREPKTDPMFPPIECGLQLCSVGERRHAGEE